MAVTFKKNPGDIIFSFITAIAACTVIVFIIGILFVLIKESSLSREKFGIVQFLTSTAWNPVTGTFGALTTIYGTFVTTGHRHLCNGNSAELFERPDWHCY